jgi:two-component system response regulator ResD
MFEERLLVIEDDKSIAMILQQIALEAGYRTMALCRSAEIESVYANFKPDVILLDILMPDMDGIDILNFLHKENSQSQLVIVSGSEYRLMAEKIARSLNLNLVANVPKPFRVPEVRLALQEIRIAAGETRQAAV